MLGRSVWIEAINAENDRCEKREGKGLIVGA
jgi:hypothetical protein